DTSYAPFDPLTYTGRGEEAQRTYGNRSLTWEWDALGRPLRATSKVGSVTVLVVDWTHDGLGRLLERSGSVGASTEYHYLGSLVMSSDRNGDLRSYLYGPHGIWRQRGSGQEDFLDRDPFGNVHLIHDGASSLEVIQYDPFGTPRDSTGSVLGGSTQDNDLLFLGRPYDYALGLSRLGARFLDSTLERFVSRDPLQEGGGSLNLYQYAYNNPFRFRDPSGLAGEGVQPGDQLPGPQADSKYYEANDQAMDEYVADNQDFLGLGSDTFDELTGEEKIKVISLAWAETQDSLDHAPAWEKGEFLQGLDYLKSKFAETYLKHPLAGLQNEIENFDFRGAVEVASYAPGPIGTVAGVIDTGIQIYDGNYGAALWGVLGIVTAGAGKWLSKADEAADLASGIAKHLDDVPAGHVDDVKVIGRHYDTKVAKGWDGHDVLDDPHWTLERNDAWVQEGIDRQQDFYTASPLDGNMIQTDGPLAGEPTVFSSELNQLENAGYVWDGDYLRHPASAGGGN
ncbi:MAG: RHS repeat-associated core domain-containing protein, partial [Planctomycetes bacterium]|nr:RHS repeat-associated core domain-containing protein [Planctomycetota bacterium]